ncbi:MAG TPA: hypothetical protein VJ483_08465 [Holophagaceae bacterium]|nr:hypothetical protein [Holophagaceae bacterium]
MAASSDFSVFLARSVKALRDLFIYLLPGGTFLALLAHVSGGYSGEHGSLPAWLVAAVFLGACYIAGTFIAILTHLLVAALFPPPDLPRLRAMGQQLGLKPPASPAAAEELRLRFHFPALFEEADRLRLIADFRLSLAGALLLGGAVLMLHVGEGQWAIHEGLILLGGLLLLLNARSGEAVAAASLDATREAARALPAPHAKAEKE